MSLQEELCPLQELAALLSCCPELVWRAFQAAVSQQPTSATEQQQEGASQAVGDATRFSTLPVHRVPSWLDSLHLPGWSQEHVVYVTLQLLWHTNAVSTCYRPPTADVPSPQAGMDNTAVDAASTAGAAAGASLVAGSAPGWLSLAGQGLPPGLLYAELAAAIIAAAETEAAAAACQLPLMAVEVLARCGAAVQAMQQQGQQPATEQQQQQQQQQQQETEGSAAPQRVQLASAWQAFSSNCSSSSSTRQSQASSIDAAGLAAAAAAEAPALNVAVATAVVMTRKLGWSGLGDVRALGYAAALVLQEAAAAAGASSGSHHMALEQQQQQEVLPEGVFCVTQGCLQETLARLGSGCSMMLQHIAATAAAAEGDRETAATSSGAEAAGAQRPAAAAALSSSDSSSSAIQGQQVKPGTSTAGSAAAGAVVQDEVGALPAVRLRRQPLTSGRLGLSRQSSGYSSLAASPWAGALHGPFHSATYGPPKVVADILRLNSGPRQLSLPCSPAHRSGSGAAAGGAAGLPGQQGPSRQQLGAHMMRWASCNMAPLLSSLRVASRQVSAAAEVPHTWGRGSALATDAQGQAAAAAAAAGAGAAAPAGASCGRVCSPAGATVLRLTSIEEVKTGTVLGQETPQLADVAAWQQQQQQTQTQTQEEHCVAMATAPPSLAGILAALDAAQQSLGAVLMESRGCEETAHSSSGQSCSRVHVQSAQHMVHVAQQQVLLLQQHMQAGLAAAVTAATTM